MWRLSLYYPHSKETRESLHHSFRTLHVLRTMAERARDYALGLVFPSWPPRATIERTNETPTGDKLIYCLATELRDARQAREELLEALRELEWACSGVEYMEAEYADKLRLARDVIAKATGSAA